MSSPALGESSSNGQWTTTLLMPYRLRNSAVPWVAKNSIPRPSNSFAPSINATLSFSVPVESRTVLIGNLNPTEIRAFKKASSKSSPRQPTSPVEAISTPKVGSAPCNLVNEKCGALTPTWSRSCHGRVTLATGTSRIAFVASSMKFTLQIFETNGKLREARRLASMTLTFVPWARYWTLNGPVTASASAIRPVIFSIFRITSG